MSGTVPGSGHRALPFSQWPAQDQDAWEAALRPPGFLDAGGKGAAWRLTSKHNGFGAYARWLGWLIAQGIDLASEEAAARITAERLRTYVNFLQERRTPITVAGYLGVLCMVVLAMFPGYDWKWLSALQARHQRQAAPSRNKPARLVPASDLFQLGLELMQRADEVLDTATEAGTHPRRVIAAARDFRDGLLIAFLASRPLRVKNFLGIEIGTQLRRSGARTTLHFEGAEMKNHRAFDTVWPETLEPALTRYLESVRPMLIAARAPGGLARIAHYPGARLWVGQGGTSFTPAALQKALARHTLPRFGHAINAHLFRDCVASTLANEDPNHARYAAQLLGHRSLRTTERTYITPNSDWALRRHHDMIASTRKLARRASRAKKSAAP